MTLHEICWQYATNEANRSGLPKRCLYWDILYSKAYWERMAELTN